MSLINKQQLSLTTLLESRVRLQVSLSKEPHCRPQGERLVLRADLDVSANPGPNHRVFLSLAALCFFSLLPTL